MIRLFPIRLRFAMAMLAMVGVMWSVIDLHQHESGLHNEHSCSICSIERALGGFTLSIVLVAAVAILVTLLIPWLNHAAALKPQSLVRIRAPPSLILPAYIQ